MDETEVLEFWEKNKIFDKLRKKIKGKKKYSFIDGPITANNPMGIHHAWGRTYKDVFQRFKAMQGFDQRFQNGFDCQGLWVEREEEKDLGLKNKQDIEKFGILNFVKACRKRVDKFSKIQRDQSIRLGQWMDWDNSYYTMSDNNNIHNWHLLKIYFENNLLYKGHDVVPWCWRCGTASSKHDIMTEGYKEVTHDSVYIEYPIKDKKNEYLLVWTTTPWTLPGNVAIAVDPEKNYVIASRSIKGNKYYLLKSVAEKLGLKIEKTLKGKNLVGLKYGSPFDNLPRVKKALGNYEHKVIEADGNIIVINDEEGTGMVHIAPGQGNEDFQLGKKLKLPVIELIDEGANYLNDMKEFSNKNAKKHPELIFDFLEKTDGGKYFFNKVPYKHRYPHCWRCGKELVFRLVDEWYIKCNNTVKQKLISENKKIKWYPEYGKTRQEDWFNNMGDWLISRKRYWGLPLPIWECECGKTEVIGSLKELKQKAINKKKVDNLPEIHRPWIDEIKIKCSKCKKEVSRIPDVGDAWLDAGIVPFSTLDYLNKKQYWKQWFPADFICENMPGQYRGWFNALFWASITLTGKAPFKTILGYETLKDEKGEEMHKSKGNAIWFDDAVEKIGADPIRLLYCLQDPSQELRFGFNVVKEPRNNLNILSNIRRLVETTKTKKITKIEDKWIISKLNNLIKQVTEELENLHPHLATRALKNFWLNDLSRGYIQFVRERISAEDKEAKSTLQEVYVPLIKLLAPIIPFTTEKIWQDLLSQRKGELQENLGFPKEQSIHLSPWPKSNPKLINNKLEQEFTTVLEIIEAGLAQRDKIQIGLKWPLAKATITTDKKIIKELQQIISQQLNVKSIQIKPGKQLAINLDTTQTPELQAEGFARELSRFIQAQRKKAGLIKTDKIQLEIISDIKNLESQKDFIQQRVNASSLTLAPSDKKFNYSEKKKIKGKDFEVRFSKL